MDSCSHPKLTEVNGTDFTGVVIEGTDQPGNVSGMFMWKKYECGQCHRLITILQAVVEKLWYTSKINHTC